MKMAAVVFQRGSCAVARPAVQRVYFPLAYLLYRWTEPQTWHCIGSEWSLKRVDCVAGVDVQTTSAWEVRAVIWTGAAIELVVYITAPNTVVYICFIVFVNLQFHVGTLVSRASQPLLHGRVWCSCVPLVVSMPRSWHDQSDSSII